METINRGITMAVYQVIIIGGGAAGLLCSLRLAQAGIKDILILERNERLGRKLSATGNGQGNITNKDMGPHRYFSSDIGMVARILQAFNERDLVKYLTDLGGYFVSDGEGKIYPASKQASSVTDIFRFAIERENISVKTGEYVRSVKKDKNIFRILTESDCYKAQAVVIATGGKASPHFGTDGNGYTLAKEFGHTLTSLKPALVQLKTDKENLKGLKGVRIDCRVKLIRGKEIYSCRGDVIFTDYGVTGNAVFKISSRAESQDILSLDFLPDCEKDTLISVLERKILRYPDLKPEDFLRCIVNSAAARAVVRAIESEQGMQKIALRRSISMIADRIKDYRLRVVGNMGFENAQVTKGGIPMNEVDEGLMSVKIPGLFFAGEILDVDGECGGYNLQWAFASGACCAKKIVEYVNDNK